jgi:hypothetical protein
LREERFHPASIADSSCRQQASSTRNGREPNFRRFRLDAEALSRTFSIEDVSRASIPHDFARRPQIHGCWILAKRLADA